MKSTGTDGKYTVELEKILNSDGTTFYDPETSQVKLEDVFGAKTTNATLGSYNQVQSGYYYDSANKNFMLEVTKTVQKSIGIRQQILLRINKIQQLHTA